MNETCIFLVLPSHKPNLIKIRTFLKICMGTTFLKMHLDVIIQTFYDVKILESRAKSFYKLVNIKILKRNITGLREVKILKLPLGLFTRKEIGGTKKIICSVSGVRSNSIVWDHCSHRHKIPSIEFCYPSSFVNASVTKSF